MSLRTCTLLLALPLAACADPGEGTSNLGVAGASCLRSADCEAPLQCIANICGGSTTLDATVPDTSLSDTGYALDGTNPWFDGVTPDINTDYDASDWTFVDVGRDAGPEVSDVHFDDCGELGVSDQWSGTFVGQIDYNITPNPLTPSQGFLPVNGSLAFEITCIESKFIVRGAMDGVATVVGQGDFPFKLDLAGYYNPTEKRMEANMVNGSVSIYGLIEVYFEGTFIGAITDEGVFNGTWDGDSTGTNQEFITGTASGQGLWGAEPE
jgi:hypothetical protein